MAKRSPKIVSVRLVDNSDKVLLALREQTELGMKAVGEQAVTYAQKGCPVDTGLLRNSLAWATENGTSGGRAPSKKAPEEPSKPKGKPEAYCVYIGSNVEYAVYVEYRDKLKHTSGGAHFIKNAVTGHTDHYKKILKAALEAGS